MAISKQAQKILLKATELISNPERWLKGGFRAKGVNGEERYCAWGAIKKASGFYDGPLSVETERAYVEVYRTLSVAVRKLHPGHTIPSFNDRPKTQHADVKALFCETVKREVTDVQD